jgi:RNA polymerase sigma-70 factor (ECF subfamily)
MPPITIEPAALANNPDAFRQHTEPHRHELQVHCYRMLGSFEESEDMVQETFLKAWRSLHTYRGEASFRAWLYRIATNTCLDTLKKAARRQLVPAPTPPDRPPLPPNPEIEWVEPYPTAAGFTINNPESRYSQHESIRLAFVVALQGLPPRQRAVLLLRDVLGWRAREVAGFLDMTVSAANSALNRARKNLSNAYHDRDESEIIGDTTLDPHSQALVERYIQAWENTNVDQLAELLKDDASLHMPPTPSWFQGRSSIAEFMAAGLFATPTGHWRGQVIQSNRQSAAAIYEKQADGSYLGIAIQVLTIEAGQISQIAAFLNPQLFEHFGLPAQLTA